MRITREQAYALSAFAWAASRYGKHENLALDLRQNASGALRVIPFEGDPDKEAITIDRDGEVRS